jgi:hypothetical protein
MSEYGLFLKYNFNDAKGIFLANAIPREPDCRFWDEVIDDPAHPGNLITVSNRMVQDPTNPTGPLIKVNSRINADTKTMELVARVNPPPAGRKTTDKVYFAVCNTGLPAPTLNNITFSCGINPEISVNKSTVGGHSDAGLRFSVC